MAVVTGLRAVWCRRGMMTAAVGATRCWRNRGSSTRFGGYGVIGYDRYVRVGGTGGSRTGRGGRMCMGIRQARCEALQFQIATNESENENTTSNPIPLDLSQMNSVSAVVKLVVTSQAPDWRNPWQRRSAEVHTGSGVLIGFDQTREKALLLTAAHVVSNATFVQVKISNLPTKMLASVVGVMHMADLALVATDSGPFLKCDPLKLADTEKLPKLRDKVYVLGYPIGGDELSVTEGVVSRVEVQTYSHSSTRALAITVDAAINSGNSGGPIIDKESGEVIAIAFQGYAGSDVENQGHGVPAPLMHHFLQSLSRKLGEASTDNVEFVGKNSKGKPESISLPSLGVHLQILQSPVLRESLMMDDGADSGILIAAIEDNGSAHGILQAGDVLLKMNGHKIQNDGTVNVLGRRLSFIALQHQMFVGESVPLDILREGKVLQVEVKLKAAKYLVPRGQYDVEPEYAIIGGILLQPLSLDYLCIWRDLKDAPVQFVREYWYGRMEPDRSQVVCLTQVLADECNIGYGLEDIGMEVVTSVNDQPLRDLYQLIQEADRVEHEYAQTGQDSYLKITFSRGSASPSVGVPVQYGNTEFDDLRVDSSYNIPLPIEQVTLRASDLKKSRERVLQRYQLPRDRSSRFGSAGAYSDSKTFSTSSTNLSDS